MRNRARPQKVLAAERKPPQQEVQRSASPVLRHVRFHLPLRAGAAVVGVLRHVGSEVRVQSARRAVQRGAHVVADEQVVEDAAPYRRHERMPRRFEGQAAVAAPIQVHEVVPAADPEIDEVVRAAQVLYRLEIACGVPRVVLLEFVGPVVSEIFGFVDDRRAGRRAYLLERVGPAAISDEGREHPPSSGMPAVLVRSNRMLLRPYAVRPLIPVQRAEGDEALDAEQVQLSLNFPVQRRLFDELAAQQQAALFVADVDHVGVSVARETQQERLVEVLHDPADEREPSMRPVRVVHVDQKPPVDVDEKDAVLVVVGHADHADPVRQPVPDAVLQDGDVESGFLEAAADAPARVVRQQDLLAEVIRLGVRVQVIGMTVRDPHVLAVPDRFRLFVGNLVRKPPASEICASDDPWIRHQDRASIVTYQRRVPDRVETHVHSVIPSSQVPFAANGNGIGGAPWKRRGGPLARPLTAGCCRASSAGSGPACRRGCATPR